VCNVPLKKVNHIHYSHIFGLVLSSFGRERERERERESARERERYREREREREREDV
jgi:hypothetical protein